MPMFDYGAGVDAPVPDALKPKPTPPATPETPTPSKKATRRGKSDPKLGDKG